MIYDIENRVKYYLGELYDLEKIIVSKTGSLSLEELIPENTKDQKTIEEYFLKYNYKKLYLIGELYNIKYISSFSIGEIIQKKLIPDMFYKCYFQDYALPLKNLLTIYKLKNYKFLCDFCDIFYNIDNYAFVKNRFGEHNKSIILRSLNKKRHWHNYYNRPNDIDFDKKLSKIFWRGTTTGSEKNPANRFSLVTKYFSKYDDIDVGFSFTCQGNDRYSKYTKGKDDINSFLKNKYILSLEGNDKDSGLNWKLNSNSLVFMPKPRSFSWLMEDRLIPDYHYILIKDDFSDLIEKLEWCNNNEEKCKTIIKNANVYMGQFANETTESLIEQRVIELYFQKVEFT